MTMILYLNGLPVMAGSMASSSVTARSAIDGAGSYSKEPTSQVRLPPPLIGRGKWRWSVAGQATLVPRSIAVLAGVIECVSVGPPLLSNVAVKLELIFC